jgi:hypothetical protein
MSHGLVCKMVNPGINYHFYINPKNDRDCHNRPCKSTQEPCKNIVRVWIVSIVHTLGFPYATAPFTHRMGRIRRFWFDGISFFCSIGKDSASFCQWDYRLFTVCSGVCNATLRDVRTDILFAPYVHHVPSWERIQGYFSPTHWGICLSKMCIFYPLDRRGKHFFGWRWKRTSWRARCYAGCPWGRHGCSWATMRVYFAREKNELIINT